MGVWWVIIYLQADILLVRGIINEILGRLRGIKLLDLCCIFCMFLNRFA